MSNRTRRISRHHNRREEIQSDDLNQPNVPTMHLIRRFGFIIMLFFIVSSSLSAEDDGPTATLTIEATWDGGCTPLLPGTARQLTIWKKGMIRFSQYGNITLIAKQVIEGKPDRADFLTRSANILRVIPIDSAAVGVDVYQMIKPSGKWVLTRLPNGLYVVSNLADTPCNGPKAQAELKKTDEMLIALGDADEKKQIEALQFFAQKTCARVIPGIAEMLQANQEKSAALHAQALAALVQIQSRLYGSITPQPSASPTYLQFWLQMLESEPFPQLVNTTVETTTIAGFPTGQGWPPDLSISGDGHFVLANIVRMERPVDQIRNGIFFMDTENLRRNTWIYKVPLSAVNCEPTPMRVAWGKSRIGVLFKEYWYDKTQRVLKFLSIDYDGKEVVPARELPIKNADHIALTADGDAWVLAYITDEGSACTVAIDSNGTVIGEPVSLGFEFNAIQSPCISITTIGNGFAVVCRNNAGLQLVILDKQLNPKSSTMTRSAATTMVSWNGKRILVAWIADGHRPNCFNIQFFNENGKEESGVIEIADHLKALAPPAAFAKGFILTWIDHSDMEYTIKTMKIDNAGNRGAINTIFQGIEDCWPIVAGNHDEGNRVRVINLDRKDTLERFFLRGSSTSPIAP